ncbi:MAG: hypothetical protein HY376_00680 [Candidatus Blackburnbacteria bacterium]|nr:hypothetical protein [Candidatus Blackburnbacteria bacterium]
MINKIYKYLGKHPRYNSTIHLVIGLGFGIILARPYVANPVKWGLALIAVGVVGHLYPYFAAKK